MPAAANACPMRATARRSNACWQQIERPFAGAGRAASIARRLCSARAAGRRAQRARLRALGSRGQAVAAAAPAMHRPADRRSRSTPPIRSRSATPEAMAERSARQRRAAAAAEDQARRRRTMSRAHPRRRAPPRPTAGIIVDANEGWTPDVLPELMRAAAEAGRRADRAAAAGRRGRARSPTSRARCPSAPTKACTTRRTSKRCAGRYDAVNIKLDKTGGLTEALALLAAPASSASASWSAAWSAPRWRWRRPCCWRRTPTMSISTARCCSPATDPRPQLCRQYRLAAATRTLGLKTGPGYAAPCPSGRRARAL